MILGDSVQVMKKLPPSIVGSQNGSIQTWIVQAGDQAILIFNLRKNSVEPPKKDLETRFSPVEYAEKILVMHHHWFDGQVSWFEESGHQIPNGIMVTGKEKHSPPS